LLKIDPTGSHLLCEHVFYLGYIAVALFDFIYEFQFTLNQLTLLLYYGRLLCDPDPTGRPLIGGGARSLSKFFMHAHWANLLQIVLV
jgi:hypothetical protein